MEGTMKAWRVLAEGTFPVLEDVPILKPKHGEILIKMGGAGICRTDLEIIDGVWKEGAGVGPFPVVLGHENAGWIAEYGEGTEDCGFAIGEAVVVEAHTHCGYCEMCRTGRSNFCLNSRVRGAEQDGGLGQYMITTPKEIVSLGDLDPRIYACLGDAAMASYGPINSAISRLTPSSTIIINGVGGLAGFGMQFAKILSGGGRVIVLGTSEERMNKALEKGADFVVKRDENAFDKIMEITGGKFVDAFFDFIGDKISKYLAAKVIKMNGLISVTGCDFESEFIFNWSTMKPGVDMRTWQGATIKELINIVTLVQKGLVKAEVQNYDFYDLPKALDDLRNKRIKGRGIITFDALNK